jgi:hypothetical protein
MTKAQEVYERVEALVASGTRKADAFRQLADEYGQPFNSIRGSYYAHTKTLGISAPTRRRTAQPQDPIESALALLRTAVNNVDADIAAAKSRADEAKAEYERLKASANERKAALEAKIDALSA